MKRGFTLIELLVVIAILAILVGIVFTAIQEHRKTNGQGQSLPIWHSLFQQNP